MGWILNNGILHNKYRNPRKENLIIMMYFMHSFFLFGKLFNVLEKGFLPILTVM